MFLLLYAVWFIFNGRITGEIALFGLPITALIYFFTLKFLDLSPKRELLFAKKIGKILRYAALLLKEIVVANFDVMRLILSPNLVVEPEIKTFKPELSSDTLRTVLADSITLTPGTITVDLKKGELTVHCLDKSLGDGLINSKMEQRLREMEGK